MKISTLILVFYCVLFLFSCKPNNENNFYSIEHTNNGIFDTIKIIDKNNIKILEINITNNDESTFYYGFKDSRGLRFDVNIAGDEYTEYTEYTNYYISFKNDFRNIVQFDDGIINGYSIGDGSGFSSVANFVENNIVSYMISDGNNYLNATNLFRDTNEQNNYLLNRQEQVNENLEFIETIYKNGLVEKEKWIRKN